jgi:primosomal protein N' (replication factor Y)
MPFTVIAETADHDTLPHFATVAVNQPVDQLFEYRVPEAIRETVRLGSLVQVPFAGRFTAGCIVSLHAELQSNVQPSKMKSIRSLISPSYFVDPQLIELSKWINGYYLSPPGETLGTVSFIGYHDIDERTLITFRLNPDWRRLLTVEQESGEERAVSSSAKKRKPSARQQELAEWLEQFPGEEFTAAQIQQQTGASPAIVKRLVARGIVQQHVRVEHRRDDYPRETDLRDSPLKFNASQQLAYEELYRSLEKRQPEVFLLYGVTGSGKTEVYLQIIAEALNSGGDAIVLVPEIALTPQAVARFRKRFGELVGVYHSRLTTGQKFDLWQRVKARDCRVMVGARSALFTPFADLRVIIIDEEHESSYKQDTAPRYHARDVAIIHAKTIGALVILGSATPSVETYYKAVTGKFRLLTLPERVEAYPLPEVRVINMADEARNAQNPDFMSTALREAISGKIQNHELVLLFINRRGFFNFMTCLDCNTAVKCVHCDVALTHHKPRNILICHHCGREYVIPKACRECGSSELTLLGLGTQRVEERLHELYPEARIIRVDLDTTRRRNSIIDLWQRIERGDYDIILGTQMIARGVHLENVTLVAVPLADVSLYQPDFRAAERAFSLLTQVAGRAGRGNKPGEVIIQTYAPYHYAIQHAQTHDYRSFYDQEIRIREVLRFPPFYRLAAILATGEDPNLTADMIGEFARYARDYAFKLQERVQILGPTPAPVSKIRDQYRWRILIRATDHRDIKAVVAFSRKQYRETPGHSRVQMIIDIDPQNLI